MIKNKIYTLIFVIFLVASLLPTVSIASPFPCTVSGYVYANTEICEPEQIILSFPNQNISASLFPSGFYIVDFSEEAGETGIFTVTLNGVEYTAEETITIQQETSVYEIDLNITITEDVEPPSQVTGLTITDAKDGKLDLSWNPATDNVGIDYYNVYRDETLIDTENSNSYQDIGLTNGQQYCYKISAVDTSENEGQQSEEECAIPTESTVTNNPPEKPGLPIPENNSEEINIDTTLSVLVIDPDNDNMDVTFYDKNDNIIESDDNVESNTRASITWSGLEYNTTYIWYAVADDEHGETNTSNLFTFKTKKQDINHPPYKPSDPTLENDSTNVDLNPELSIFVEDPDDDNLKVDFFNASDDSIIGTLTNVESRTYATITWNDLSYNMTYSWYAKANDSEYTNTSDIFYFKTKNKQEPDNPPEINITFPKKGGLYYKDEIYLEEFLKTPIIIGNITIKANATDDKKIERVEFFISSINDMDGKSIGNATEYPYNINWEIEGFRLIHLYSIKAVAYDNSGNTSFDEVPIVRKFF